MKPGRQHRFTRIALAVSSVALVASACTSDPSAKRVAEDLINTLAETDAERECMLEILDGYSQDELEDIGNDANGGDDAEQAAAQVQLDELEARLSSCR